MICKILDSGSFAYMAQNPDNPVNLVQKQGAFCQPPNMNYELRGSCKTKFFIAEQQGFRRDAKPMYVHKG